MQTKSYFTIDELCKSNKADLYKINNTPDEEIKKHLNTLIEFLNPLRESWGSGIRINSGYRCPELNQKVGSGKTSAHLIGYAVDMYPMNNDFEKFKTFIQDYLKDKRFDQCIIEKSENSQWIHLGLYNQKGQQRKMIFNIIK